MSDTNKIIYIKDPRIFKGISAILNLDTGEITWMGGWFTSELSEFEKAKFEFEWRKNFKIQK